MSSVYILSGYIIVAPPVGKKLMKERLLSKVLEEQTKL